MIRTGISNPLTLSQQSDKFSNAAINRQDWISIWNDKDILLFISSNLQGYIDCSEIGIIEKTEFTNFALKLLHETSFIDNYDFTNYINISYYDWRIGDILK